MMIAHHLFNTGIISQSVDWGFPANSPLIAYMGACVAIFAMVTGYGFAHIAEHSAGSPFKAGFIRAKHFYLIYAPMFVCVAAASRFLPEVNGFHIVSLEQAGLALIGYCPNSTITDWWYATFFFAVCLIVFPGFLCLRSFLKRFAGFDTALAVTLLCVLNIMLWKMLGNWSQGAEGNAKFIYFTRIMRDILSFTPYFFLGFLYYCFGRSKFESKEIFSIAVAVLAIAITVVVTKWREFSAVAVLSVFLTVVFARYFHALRKILLILGKYSVYMWLTHRFVFGCWFAGFFYSLNPLLSYLLVVAITFAISVVLDHVIFKPIQKLLSRGSELSPAS